MKKIQDAQPFEMSRGQCLGHFLFFEIGLKLKKSAVKIFRLLV